MNDTIFKVTIQYPNPKDKDIAILQFGFVGATQHVIHFTSSDEDVATFWDWLMALNSQHPDEFASYTLRDTKMTYRINDLMEVCAVLNDFWLTRLEGQVTTTMP